MIIAAGCLVPIMGNAAGLYTVSGKNYFFAAVSLLTRICRDRILS